VSLLIILTIIMSVSVLMLLAHIMAILMSEFIWCLYARLTANPLTKPTDLGCKSPIGF